MFERNLAEKLKGWNLISDATKKLHVKKSTAYIYLHKLDKKGFVIQKVKKPRGTMYLIDSVPKLSKNQGMLSNTDLVSSEMEFSNTKIFPEHKVAYFLNKFKTEKNLRYRQEAKKIIRSIKNWKRLYKYLKAYKVNDEFRKLYIQARKTIKKMPSMPQRYKKLIGV